MQGDDEGNDERGRGLRLVIEASASDPAERLLHLPWELLFYQTPL